MRPSQESGHHHINGPKMESPNVDVSQWQESQPGKDNEQSPEREAQGDECLYEESLQVEVCREFGGHRSGIDLVEL